MRAGVDRVERWRQNPLVLAPADAFVAEVAPLRTTAALLGEVASLASGSPVILCSPPPFARRRCRRFASAAGVDIQREYLAVPTAAAPAYLVEDAPVAIAYFLRSILVPPPRTIWAAPFRLCLSAVSKLANPGSIVRVLAPRLVVGTRR